MPWTAPRTWVALERLSAALLNQHVRDNLAWLGTEAPVCILTHSANQELTADNTFYDLAFDTETHDPQDMHDLDDNTKVIVPASGIYDVFPMVSFESNITGYRDLVVRKNGASDVARFQTAAAPASSVETVSGTSMLLKLAAGDVLQVRARHNAGVPLDVIGGVAYSPLFAVAWRRTA